MAKLKTDEHSSKVVSFCLDRSTQQLIVGDRFNSINYYDYRLKFIKKEPLFLFYKDFEMMPDNMLAFCAAKLINYETGTWLNGYNSKPVGFGLWFRDKTGKLSQDFPFSLKIFPNGSEYTEIPKTFSRFNGNLYYNYALNDTIFTLTKSGAQSRYFIDFGKKSSKEDLKQKPGKWLFDFFTKNHDIAIMPQNFIETRKVIKFDYFIGTELQTAILNKENNEIVYGKIVNDLYGFPIVLSQVLENGHILATVQPDVIFNLIKEDKNRNQPWLQKLKKLAQKIKAGDNCILMDIRIR